MNMPSFQFEVENDNQFFFWFFLFFLVFFYLLDEKTKQNRLFV